MIQQPYLNELAQYTNTAIDNILINDSILITSFNQKQVSASVVEIQYSVLQSQTTNITDIKMRKSDNSIISHNVVNIPINQTEALIRQTITVVEVV